MSDLPTGTVTLLFTDMEGSTRLVQQLGDGYAGLLGDHHRLLRDAFRERGGVDAGSAGDGLYFSFGTARAALDAAVAGQRAIRAHPWPQGAEVRVRMGLHTGEPISGELGYLGVDVHRAARISSAGHGDQILISGTTRDLVGSDLPAGIQLVDLGEHLLKDLAAPQRLYQVAAEGLPSDFPPPRSIDARPNNLPRQLTTFVGRGAELADAKRMLLEAPLVTLSGPGGVGKTRLALELATESLDAYADGVWVVEFGAVTDPEFLPQAIAAVRGLGEYPGRSMLDTVIAHFADRQALLVLDNCEHVIDAAARVSDAILRACPRVRILATSREALGVPGEAVLPVASLSLPDRTRRPSPGDLAHSDALRLFGDRAASAVPSFRVDESNVSWVAQICWRLDGVPLAIELAAARVRSLSVEQICTRLDDRFRLLTGSSRISVPRHQTLRATMDWSYDLLPPEEQTLLCRLSVFAGGCSLEAAEAVCADGALAGEDVLDLISRLVDKSLALADPTDDGVRFRMLETVREYARDKLIEMGDARDTHMRHRDWYLALAEQAAPQFFRGPESRVWLDRLETEDENLRAALNWCEDEPGEAHAGLRMVDAMWRFWEIRGRIAEGRIRLERSLAATDGEVSRQRANALVGAGVLASMQGDLSASLRFQEESLAITRELGDPKEIAWALNNVANTSLAAGDLVNARRLAEESVEMTVAIGDMRSAAIGMTNMADIVARQGDFEGARSIFDQSVSIFREHRDRWGEAFALDSHAAAVIREGHAEEAQRLDTLALSIFEELGDGRGAARALTRLAEIAQGRRDNAAAREMALRSLAIRRAMGDQPGIAAGLENLAWVIGSAEPEAAARLLGCAETVRQEIRAPLAAAARAEYISRARVLAESMGWERFEAARAEGAELSPTDVLATLPL